jgi:hypothetical protein
VVVKVVGELCVLLFEGPSRQRQRQRLCGHGEVAIGERKKRKRASDRLAPARTATTSPNRKKRPRK